MKRKSSRGALVIIAILFAASGALRLGDGLGSALAEASKEAHTPQEAPAGIAEAAGPAGDCPAPPAALAAALSEREGRLAAQEAAVADREAALALADEAITGRLAELQVAEEEMRKTFGACRWGGRSRHRPPGGSLRNHEAQGCLTAV